MSEKDIMLSGYPKCEIGSRYSKTRSASDLLFFHVSRSPRSVSDPKSDKKLNERFGRGNDNVRFIELRSGKRELVTGRSRER